MERTFRGDQSTARLDGAGAGNGRCLRVRAADCKSRGRQGHHYVEQRQKIARARDFGADEAINYRTQPNWGKAARDLTEHGVDCVIEVGGERTLAQSIDALRNGGRISYVGFLSGTASGSTSARLAERVCGSRASALVIATASSRCAARSRPPG